MADDLKIYEPELGQMLFGNPPKEFDVPGDVEEALDAIRCAIGVFHPAIDNPFSNCGQRFRFSCFRVHAYDWGAADDEEGPGQPWNFQWRDFEISWYKYWGRGMSRNRKISRTELVEMIRECLLAVMNEQPQEDER